MDLSNIPFFQRPMQARKGDQFVGQDEAGNNVYRMGNGDTYTVKPSADQRTTRTKIEEDVVPAVKEFASNPSLPSAEQMKQFGADVVEGTYESIKGAVEGTGTMGDAFGVAPAMGIASAPFEVPEGAVRSFGGKSKNVVPRFKMHGETTNFPNPTFGNKKLRDIFEEDQWENNLDLEIWDPEVGDFVNSDPLFVNPDNGDTFGTGPEFNLGYAPNLRVHDLADIALGRKTPEEALDYIGMDPESNLVSYVNQRLSNLQERPEFQEYLERYRGLNEEYDPYDALQTNPRTGNEVATFRSPIPEVLSNLDFPKNGIKGSQLLKEFQDSPSIRGSELKSLGVDINPQQRYSKEEVDSLFEGKLWNASAYIVENPMYSAYQRQQVLDPTVDYFELIVNADKQGGENFRAISQHFENNTLSHARASVKADTWTGQDYILLEELQSDLLQKGFETKKLPDRDRIYAIYGIDEPENYLMELSGASDQEILEGVRLAFQMKDFTSSSQMPKELKDSYADFIEKSSAGSYRAYNMARQVFNYENYDDRTANELLKEIRDDLGSSKKEAQRPPIQKTEEGVRLAFDGLLAEAANRGINRIVIPPFERIVAERFTPGSSDYFKALEPTSGFYATYKKAIDKILKEYEQEFGRENFSTRLVDIDYVPVAYVDKRDPDNRRTIDLPVTGTEVFFKGAIDKGYDFTKPRFAEGGLVQNYNQGGSVSMDKQMKLFQEGGISDDGMNRDPVSGNEVPPGSLSKEVRDDVDAKLSEGEYVVPADVVRFFGVDYFEKLRKKAKEGLAQMDADGRIGGEPVPEGPEDDLPFSDEELAFLEESEGEPVQMAEGGVVSGFAEGLEQEMTTPSVQTEVYRNAQGEQRTIMFVNGQPIQRIPEGFTKAPKEGLTNSPEDAKVGNQQANREGGIGTDGTDSGFGNEAGTATGGFADAMAGAMDGAFGGGGKGGLGGALGGIGSAIGGAVSGAFGGGGGGGASAGPSAGASTGGPNGGMGGYANRGMLVDRTVKQKPQPKPEGKGLVKRKAKK
jgi:hypothetical protein